MHTRIAFGAALLLTASASVVASAAEVPDPDHRNKSAKKVLATLDMVGINSAEVKDFVSSADAHISNGYVFFNEQKVEGGNLSIRYHIHGREDDDPFPDGSKKFGIHYVPENSHFHFTAHTNSVMANYHIELH